MKGETQVNKHNRKTSGTVLGVLLGAIGLAWLANKKPAAEAESKPAPEKKSKAKEKPAPMKVVQGGKAAAS